MLNTYHFEHVSGDTLKLTLTLTENGLPLDLTGATARTAIKKTYDDPSYSVSPTDATVNVDSTSGKISIVIPGSKISLPKGKYVYDVEVTYQDGTVQTVLVGEISMYPDVSK